MEEGEGQVGRVAVDMEVADLATAAAVEGRAADGEVDLEGAAMARVVMVAERAEMTAEWEVRRAIRVEWEEETAAGEMEVDTVEVVMEEAREAVRGVGRMEVAVVVVAVEMEEGAMEAAVVGWVVEKAEVVKAEGKGEARAGEEPVEVKRVGKVKEGKVVG